MIGYTLRRLLLLPPTVLVISMIAFFLIQLPPGGYLIEYIGQLQSSGAVVDQAQISALERQYGLGQPVWVQYLLWLSGILHGDFGRSLTWNAPVRDLIGERLGLTVVLSLVALLFTWLISFPVGVYSAVRQYSIGDYVSTFLTFVGLGIPGFLLALAVMWLAFTRLGIDIEGLLSPAYTSAPWSLGKVVDLAQHVWIPAVMIGLPSAAGIIRVMRANLLDELRKPYVVTARAKGLSEMRLIAKYPVRVALIPFVSTVGWTLPGIVSGAVIVSVVMNLPTTGPMLLRALLAQDMYLAGTFVLLLSVLTVVGTLVSDILLAWLDPRIRYQ